MSNKEFYDDVSEKIIYECKKEEEYIEIYKKIKEYERTHNVTEKEKTSYISSGAAEILAVATHGYRYPEDN